MNIQEMMDSIRRMPGFADAVGMLAAHNGVARGFSRSDSSTVTGIEVKPDRERMEAIRTEMESRPGIFCILAEAEGGYVAPGEELLRLVVAGDIRENVLPVLGELLDRIKAEAVSKREIFAD
jgi:molybdopterin synthase catalytic subunit